jgi:hypothetical protein
MKEVHTMDFDRSTYKVRTWKSPIMLFWVLNPIVAIDEFFLGRRAPKVILIGKGKGGTKKGVGYVPCPHCGTIHSGLEWSRQNHTLYKNWFGLYCKDCGKIIPCLYSVVSYVLLGLTFPIWYWFKDKWKAEWLEEQRIKFSKPLNLELPNFTWWKVGLKWGAWMYVVLTLILPLIMGESITVHKLISGFFFWVVAGLVFGLWIKFIAVRRKPTAPVGIPLPGGE